MSLAVQAAEKEAELTTLKKRTVTLEEENRTLQQETTSLRLAASNGALNVSDSISALRYEISTREAEMEQTRTYLTNLNANVVETIEGLLQRLHKAEVRRLLPHPFPLLSIL